MTDLPWHQTNSTRPIYSAQGNLVSFTQEATRILLAMNLAHEIATTPEFTIPTHIWLLAREIAGVSDGNLRMGNRISSGHLLLRAFILHGQ